MRSLLLSLYPCLSCLLPPMQAGDWWREGGESGEGRSEIPPQYRVNGAAVAPLLGRLGVDGEGVEAAAQLVGQHIVDHAVAINQLHSVELVGHQHHLEVCLAACEKREREGNIIRVE